ncbi:MAG: Omp28-related outer membrane protein [Bacteroidales bacterium]|nr:Omp28-related outer membrane protein [Bacteroidales bacterium]
MKKILQLLTFFALMISISINAISQTYVDTVPANKNVILEEFTGVKCGNCPAGHAVAASILQNNPGRAFAIAFHPYNSSYTTPYPGNPDFRRHHPDAFYSTPYCGSSRFMPSAFINRRKWGGERIQSRTKWVQYSNQLLAESSPVNVGLATAYDSLTSELTITVEIYYTDNMTDQNTLNVALTESNLIAQQSGGGTNYVHYHIFRETFTAQWGDSITEPTTQGSFITKSFIFNNSASEYIMSNCEVIAYIVNADNDEVLSGIGVEVGENTNQYPPVAEFSADNTFIAVGESAVFTDMSTGTPTTWEWTFDGGTPATSNLQQPPDIFYNQSGTYEVSLTVTNQNGSSTETKSDYITVGINGLNDQTVKSDDFLIYPNPTNGIFNIENENINTENFKVYVANSLGNTLYNVVINNKAKNNFQIDISNQPKGIYYLIIRKNDKNIVKKISLIE